MFSSLDPTKVDGNDSRSACMLKSTINTIAPFLTKLFNTSIQWGYIPRNWKDAIIVPVPKTKVAMNSTYSQSSVRSSSGTFSF